VEPFKIGQTCHSLFNLLSFVAHANYPRQVVVGNDVDKFQSSGLGMQPGGSGNGGAPPAPVEKIKKVIPLSKKVTNKISSSATKLTEVMAWEAKVADNTALSIFVETKTFCMCFFQPLSLGSMIRLRFYFVI